MHTTVTVSRNLMAAESAAQSQRMYNGRLGRTELRLRRAIGVPVGHWLPLLFCPAVKASSTATFDFDREAGAVGLLRAAFDI